METKFAADGVGIGVSIAIWCLGRNLASNRRFFKPPYLVTCMEVPSPSHLEYMPRGGHFMGAEPPWMPRKASRVEPKRLKKESWRKWGKMGHDYASGHACFGELIMSDVHAHYIFLFFIFCFLMFFNSALWWTFTPSFRG